MTGFDEYAYMDEQRRLRREKLQAEQKRNREYYKRLDPAQACELILKSVEKMRLQLDNIKSELIDLIDKINDAESELDEDYD